jgi:lipopolysaccharide export system permease protein
LRSTLFKYISREIWSVFVVSLIVFIFIVLAAMMMNLLDYLNQGLSLRQLPRMLLYYLPEIILFSLPAACLMSGMLGFIRLGSDNEIIALNSSGISLYQMLPPVILFSIVGLLFAGFLAICGVPWGNSSSNNYLVEIKSKTDFVPRERVFYPFSGLIFYVNSVSREKEMKDIFVMDRTNEPIIYTIIAERGIIRRDTRSNTVTIHFINGMMFDNKNDLQYTRTATFREYDYSFDLPQSARKEKKPKEMNIRELINNLKQQNVNISKKNEMGITLYEMFSIPLAIFIMAIIGASLGSHVKASGRTKGVVISLFVFIVYYVSLMCSRYICELGLAPPYIGVWVPVMFLWGTCLFLLLMVRKNSRYNFFH